MAKYSNTKAKINEKITTNSVQAITGNVLNEVLQTMVDSLGADYQFGGLVQPNSTFTAGEQPVVFLATTPGTYTNFGGLVVADGEVALLVWSGTAWSKQTPDIATRTEVSQLGQEVTGNIVKDVTWSNGYVPSATGLIKTSPLSQFSQPILLKAGETVRIGTQNSNIGIICSTNADSVAVGDTVTVIKATSSSGQYETYEYTADADIKIVICVLASNYNLSFYDDDNLTKKVSNAATKQELISLGQKVDENESSPFFSTKNGFVIGSINTINGTDFAQGDTMRTGFVPINEDVLVVLTFARSNITASDVYVCKYLGDSYVGYFNPTNPTKFFIRKDATFDSIRIRVGAIPPKLTTDDVDRSSFSISYESEKDAIIGIDNDIFNLSKSVFVSQQYGFSVGRINLATGQDIDNNTAIRTVPFTISKTVNIRIVDPQRSAAYRTAYILKYLGNSYVGYFSQNILSGSSDVLVEKEQTFDTLRLMFYDGNNWAGDDASKASAIIIDTSITSVETIANNPVVSNSYSVTEDALEGTILQDFFFGSEMWTFLSGRNCYIKKVEEGDVVVVKANPTKPSYIAFTDFFIPPKNTAPTGFVRIEIPAGMTNSFVVPKGNSFLLIDGDAGSVGNYTPVSATVIHFGIDKYDFKTEKNDLDVRSIKNKTVSFIESQIAKSKVFEIVPQNIVPTTGVFLSFYNGHLYITINGSRHEINYL